MYLLLLVWCRSVNIMIVLRTAVGKNASHHLQAWGSVFSFDGFIYLSNAIDTGESHACKGRSILTGVLGVWWKLFELLRSSGGFNVLCYPTVIFLSKRLG